MTEPKCLSTEEWLTSVAYSYNGIFVNKNELNTDTIWMNLESIMLS